MSVALCIHRSRILSSFLVNRVRVPLRTGRGGVWSRDDNGVRGGYVMVLTPWGGRVVVGIR